MYSLVFGDAGVATVTQILRDEITQNLRLLGATKLSELNPAMVRYVPGFIRCCCAHTLLFYFR